VKQVRKRCVRPAERREDDSPADGTPEVNDRVRRLLKRLEG
jgi:hypothetical protein